MLADKLKSAGSDLSSAASRLSTEVKEASAVNFTTTSIPSIGFEPAVVGAVCSLPEGKVSNPIEGNNGVYLTKVTSVSTGTDSDVKSEKLRLAQALGYRGGSQVFESLKKNTEIEDKRSKFY
jgi:peptidyl-prolyl cis-trans isomerase D